MWLKVKEAHDKILTEEQKLAIKDERIRLKEVDEERAKKLEEKNQLKELGKPKRPTAFDLFFIDETKKSQTNVATVTSKYRALDDAQKTAYKRKAAANLNEYR